MAHTHTAASPFTADGSSLLKPIQATLRLKFIRITNNVEQQTTKNDKSGHIYALEGKRETANMTLTETVTKRNDTTPGIDTEGPNSNGLEINS